jgi:zinc protease
MFMLYKPNFSAEQIVQQAQEEIAKLQNELVDPKELERARTLLRSDQITSLQSSLRRAQLLGQYEIFDGKPDLINSEMDKMLAVTPAEIQAAAKKYLTPERRFVLEVVPAPKSPPSGAAQKESK